MKYLINILAIFGLGALIWWAYYVAPEWVNGIMWLFGALLGL